LCDLFIQHVIQINISNSTSVAYLRYIYFFKILKLTLKSVRSLYSTKCFEVTFKHMLTNKYTINTLQNILYYTLFCNIYSVTQFRFVAKTYM